MYAIDSFSSPFEAEGSEFKLSSRKRVKEYASTTPSIRRTTPQKTASYIRKEIVFALLGNRKRIITLSLE